MNSINKEDKILSVIKMQHKQSEVNFIDQNCNKPSLKLNNNELLKIRSSNKNIILHFRDLAKDLLPLLSIEDIILITDSQLVLIDSIIRDDNKKSVFFETGVIFSPNSLGTNALSLARELKETVYLEPEDHYIFYFKNWSSLAVPLMVNDNILAFLGVLGGNISKEMLVLIKICAELISSKFKLCKHNTDIPIKLTKKQKIILEYLVKGFKEQAIAQELDVSIHNIKYHKRNIFRKMKVNSTQKLVYKALKSGIINIEEIDNKFDISS